MPLFDRIARAVSAFRLERRAFGGATTQTSFDYTDSTLQELTDDTGKPSASATAAVQFALGLTSRAFMVAEVMPLTPDTTQLTPELLAMTARELLARGNAVFEMLRGARAGGLTLLPVPGFEIDGGLLPSQWVYALKWFDQNENEILRVARQDAVIHVRYGATALAPWYGQSPLVAAGMDAKVLANIVNRLGDDASTPVAHIIPMPDGATESQRQAAARDVSAARGGVTFPETTKGGIGQGPQAAPGRDFEPRRVGPAPDANALALQDSAAMALLRALGIPPGLYSGSGGASREAYRQFYAITCNPLARLIEAELRVKFNLPELTISLDDLAAIDITAKSRALQGFVAAGIPLSEALKMAGFKNVEVPAVPAAPPVPTE